MANFVVFLSDAPARDPAVTGGKGSVLAKLVKAKLPVPDGFVVTTAAFERGVGDLLPTIEKSIDGLPPDDQAPLVARGAALEEVSKNAIELLKGLKIPADIADAITDAYDGLGGGSVAVRSSATAEDMPEASFAGQYDTYLNVLTPKSVVQRVLDVWASLYSVHAIAYRKRQGIAERALRMAVVIQRLLPADAAGVLFTRDPVSGADDRFIINVAYGLGEGVVDGVVPVDTFALRPGSGRVVSKEIADKRHKMDLAARGGLKRTAVGQPHRKRAALSARQVGDLARLAKRVKKLFGGHQDIEFAVHNGSVHLLQARPVTGVDDTPEFVVDWKHKGDEKHGWLLLQGRKNVKPAKRLARDIQLAQAAASRVCFKETGSAMTRVHYFSYFNGYGYGHGPNVSEETVRKRRQRHRQRVDWYSRRRRSYWEEVVQPHVERELAALANVPARHASLSEHIGYLERAIDGFAHVFGDLHWRLVGDGDPMEWTKTLAELTGMDQSDVGVFVQAADNIETRLIRAMRQLARQVTRSPTLRKIFAERDFEQIDSVERRSNPSVRRFRSSFRRFLTRYGLRTGYGFGSSASIRETPTWNMDHQRPLRIIAAYAERDLSAMERVEADARKERDKVTRGVRRTLAGSKARLQRFEIALAQGRNFVRMMEDHNNMMEQNTGGRLREAIHRAGLEFIQRGLMDRPEQLQHLSLAELKAFANGHSPGKIRDLIREREREYQEQNRLQPPPKLGSGDLPPPPAMAKTWEVPEDAGRSGSTIKGVSGSRGRATGRARVFAETDQVPDVEEGDILVAPNAGPDWTPIFPVLAGIVLDQGAVFQHAALIAREYKIPAVIMTKEASTTIKDGSTITVDGDQGIVELEEVLADGARTKFPVVWEDPKDAKLLWALRDALRGSRLGSVLPVKRLEEDAALRYAERSRVCFEETGSPLARMHIIRFVNGYAYGRQPKVDEAAVSKRLQRQFEAVAAYGARGESWWEEFLKPQVDEVLDPLTAFRPRGATLPALVNHLDQAMNAFALVLGDLHWRLAVRRGTGEPMAWAGAFSELTGKEERDAGVLVQAIDNETTRMVGRLRELARSVQEDTTLRKVFADGSFERLKEPAAQRKASVRRFQSRFQTFLKRYGRRNGRGFGSATDFMTRTWNMSPHEPLELIASYAEQDLGAIDQMEADARTERERTIASYREQFAHDPERLKRFNDIVFQSQDDVELMENHNFLMEQMTGGAFREAIWWVGKRLVRDGLLDDPDDVMHLAMIELKALATGKRKIDVAELVRERKQEYERRSQLTPPPIIGSGDPATAPPMPRWMELPANVGQDGQRLRGVSGSRGRATGRARVVPPTAKPPQVEKGEILVASNAGPNWTPIFPLIGGLVLDQGAVFQHAALVAREYKIPAVIMTKEATSVIKDGETITVDGDAGVVELE